MSSFSVKHSTELILLLFGIEVSNFIESTMNIIIQNNILLLSRIFCDIYLTTYNKATCEICTDYRIDQYLMKTKQE